MYVYESHMGGLFVSESELSFEECYCETCGDLDWLVGYAESRAEAWALLEDDTDINGSGGWDYEYVRMFIDGNWGN